MKRSKVLEKLTDRLMCYYDTEDEAEFYAKSFLDEVESIGMLPPFDSHACYMDGDNANQESVMYCKWEKE